MSFFLEWFCLHVRIFVIQFYLFIFNFYSLPGGQEGSAKEVHISLKRKRTLELVTSDASAANMSSPFRQLTLL